MLAMHARHATAQHTAFQAGATLLQRRPVLLAGHPHLHSWVCLVHELKQLVDHCLEELPMLTQELGVLPHNIPARNSMHAHRLEK